MTEMKIALIVPAYRPTQDMIPMLERFVQDERFLPVVVNDGSGEAYDPIFAQIPEGCVFLRHEVNRGKGAALKTAMRHILDKLPQCALAVTADADGQHRYEDIMKVIKLAGEKPHTLVLGSRKFDGQVPLRSRFGNGLTRQVFAAASGVKVYDTQTGLRAFGRSDMEKFVSIPGERYEYEINMLLYAARNGISILEETIQTVYIDDNSASSFHPVRDSLKIYFCILKFVASSLAGFAVDYVMLFVFNAIFSGMKREIGLLLSVVLARIISASVNFTLNKVVVFQSKGDWKKELARYAALAVVILVANYLLLNLLNIHLGWPLWIAKLLVEVVLFTLNFMVQGRLVYKNK